MAPAAAQKAAAEAAVQKAAVMAQEAAASAPKAAVAAAQGLEGQIRFSQVKRSLLKSHPGKNRRMAKARLKNTLYAEHHVIHFNA
jgi:hypothetical protein